MPTFTITDVSSNVRDWNSTQGGPMKEYRVHLQGTDPSAPQILNVEWSRKATSPPPAKGQQIEGTLEDRGSHGMKLKVAPSFGGGGFRGGSRDTPETRRSIAMQHAQKCAVDALRLAAEHGPYVPPNAGDVAAQIKSVAAVLWQQVIDAEQGA